MATRITALVLIGLVASVVGVLVWVNKRDQRRDAGYRMGNNP